MEELKWLGRRGATCFGLTSPAVRFKDVLCGFAFASD